ncbi:glycine-rich domain-containing protein [Streptomyces sp. H27-D2]|uniref:glycine-rich domain-containing protein n=1 Tax=Streptomyces sp. H27-D2 TaxID=3046304 RepID=UPI002DC04B10|nr:hypothetical protein [Streptomyces sp. H27-D2]MEC4019403.1 hypothetical protein [Streptomyces sp. H27-D2]
MSRALLTDEDFDAVTATVLDNNPTMATEMAERIVHQALAFVGAAALHPDGRMAPSRVVDEGWHALILHTDTYAALCRRLGGFVHHYPERPDPTRFNAETVERTVALIEEAGYTVDHDLWRAPDNELVSAAAKCQHSDDKGPIVIIPKPKG